MKKMKLETREQLELAIFSSKMLLNIIDIIFEDFEKYKDLHLEALKRTLGDKENAKVQEEDNQTNAV